MSKLKSLICILLCACLLTGCAGTAVEFTPQQEIPAVTDQLQAEEAGQNENPEGSPVDEWDEEAREIADRIKAQQEAYFASSLPMAGGEKLVPYLGNIYYFGDSTLLNHAYGLGTIGGKVLTEPVFDFIWPVKDKNEPNEELYLCAISDRDTGVSVYPVVSAYGRFVRWAESDEVWSNAELDSGWINCGSDDSAFIRVGDKDAGLGSIIDDGIYHIDVEYKDISDEFWGEEREEGWVHYDFVDLGEGPYDICRNSDGKIVGSTDSVDGWTDPDLYPFDSHEGRMYCIVSGDCLVTVNKDFESVITVPNPAKATDISPEGIAVNISERERCNLNLFLSNFSEQRFCGGGNYNYFDASDIREEQLFSFAYLWAKINEPELISYEASEAVISLASVNEILGEKFGLALSPEESALGNDYSFKLADGFSEWTCRLLDGKYYFPAADGASYNRFTVVEAVRVNGEELQIDFSVYEVDMQLYSDTNGVPSDLYFLTSERAPDFVKAGKISFVQQGSAVCSFDWSAEGEHTNFRLLRYELE